jgi:hypothetical protein
VVVVAALVVAIPAFASGHPRAAMHATSFPALLCIGPVAPASSGVVLAPAPQAQARPHGHKRRKHSKGAPPFRCIPPCAWIATEPAGATGVTGRAWPADCEPRPVCVRADAGQARLCPPCVVESTRDPDDATRPAGATGATLACLPVRCLVPHPYVTGGATGATTACPLPPICPLMGTPRASICPVPCAFAGTGAATGTKALCPPIPPCPPSPVATSTPAALYACPEIAGGSVTAG